MVSTSIVTDNNTCKFWIWNNFLEQGFHSLEIFQFAVKLSKCGLDELICSIVPSEIQHSKQFDIVKCHFQCILIQVKTSISFFDFQKLLLLKPKETLDCDFAAAQIICAYRQYKIKFTTTVSPPTCLHFCLLPLSVLFFPDQSQLPALECLPPLSTWVLIILKNFLFPSSDTNTSTQGVDYTHSGGFQILDF